MRHHRLTIGEDLPSIKVEEAADADAEAAGAEEGADATVQHLHHTRRSRAHAARGPSQHQEVEGIFHHQREASSKDAAQGAEEVEGAAAERAAPPRSESL